MTNFLLARDPRTEPVVRRVFDPIAGKWRIHIQSKKIRMTEEEKGQFLLEYAEHGRISDAAASVGLSAAQVRKELKDDLEFAEGFEIAEETYRDKLIAHHQNLVFNGTVKRVYDKEGNVIAEEQIFPIQLIAMELKKHDPAYRDKQEISMKVSGGVLVAPAEVPTIDDWEKKFGEMKDVTPTD